MEWVDEALILDVSNYGEHAAIIYLFSRKYGRYNAMSKAARASKQRAIFQPANLVEATWKARLQEHMGSVSCELVQSLGAMVMSDKLRLTAMMSLCALVKQAVPERDPHPELYEKVRMLALQITHDDVDIWETAYARFEWALLSQCGIGLDISECVATGVRENLVYVSPKSGRAVCAVAGLPYHAKLLELPVFLHDECATATHKDIADALALTGYFLEHWWCKPNNLLMPSARARLVNLLARA